jgi:hypothetical protein
VRPHACEQLSDAERLDHVVDRARVQAGDLRPGFKRPRAAM